MLKTTHPAPKIEILSLKGGVLLLQLQDALISPVSGRNLGILSLRGIQSEECDSLSQGSCRAWILIQDLAVHSGCQRNGGDVRLPIALWQSLA
ncbi:hypothetical protein ACFQY5_34000 [Paeniroseomonas aquatica]|uniref:Uncharacterized protein n=1 Tax=Paeniroseomonas aquatica TaxID=373043 RepID=A0ABT8A3U7_9PROT|nr:hypothetical protein [Paeniroseomonas aquatica]MDN3564348.1 hypothetical protein [Paeniroseomonas aquatica]